MATERPRPNHDDDADYNDDEYLDLERLVRYSKLSLRTLQRYLHAADNPLPHLVVRSPGKTTGRGRILVRKRVFDEWVNQFATPTVAEPAVPPAPRRWVG